nr:hypothetical protein Iba_chr06bCG11910 [Ipomoea batatas]
MRGEQRRRRVCDGGEFSSFGYLSPPVGEEDDEMAGSYSSSCCISILQEEEAKERDDGADVERSVAAGDGLKLEKVLCLLGVGVLAS